MGRSNLTCWAELTMKLTELLELGTPDPGTAYRN